ncbi:MAG TPA: alpha-2-macroglobulin family protein [Bacteroidales bacterium]|nr:alpha-2-macroglobulin family protein [Bacteroidales bacterium]
MKKLFLLLMSATMLIYIDSCQNGTDRQVMSDPSEFEGLVSGFTSGQLSKDAEINVVLARPVEGIQPGSTLPAGVLSFKPDIEGSAILEDRFTIIFKPSSSLISGQQYQASLDLQKLFEVPDESKQFIFGFSVLEQDFTVFRGQLLQTGTDNQQSQQYHGKLITADEMQVDEVAKLLKASSPQKKFDVKITPEGINTFSYLIEEIERMDNAYDLTISWNGAPLDIKKKGSFTIEIPSIHEFDLVSHSVNQDEQSVTLIFSDPTDDGQQLAGLITIEGINDIRLARNQNTVTLFPKQRLSGEQRITIEGTLRSSKGIMLGKTLQLIVAMEPLKPQVEILGNGNIIPDSRELILPFRAVSLKAVDVFVYKVFSDNVNQYFQENTLGNGQNLRTVGRPVFMQSVRLDNNPSADLSQWNAFSVDLTRMVRTDPTAIYQVKFTFKKEYALCECTEEYPDLPEVKDISLSEAEQNWWDGNGYWYNYWPDNWRWEDRDNPCTDSYYTSDKFPRRNLLASNIGIIAKSGNNRSFMIAITDLITTAPIGGAKVDFFNYQQQKIGEVTTSADGTATIDLENTPYLIAASKDGQQSWLRVDNGASLSLSGFDVSGNEIQKGLKGFIYGERGVWRPGDTLFLTFAMENVKQDLPANHPVLFELFDARGNLADKQVKTEGTDNFYTFITPTSAEAPTGNWKAKVTVGGAVFEHRLKIENVKPNRLKMELNFTHDLLTTGDQSVKLRSMWLHGTPAAQLKAQVSMKLLQSGHVFKKFEQFTFTDPARNFYPVENAVYEGILNNSGETTFQLNMPKDSWAPGMLNAVFTTRVFEKSGDFSTDVFTMPFAPFKHFVGLKIKGADTHGSILETDKDHKIEVATVDYTGKPVSLSNLVLKVYKLSWRWWWGSGSNNLASWVSGQGSELIRESAFNTVDGKASLTFRVDYPDWGQYYVQVIDPKGHHSSGMIIEVDWPSSYSRTGRKNPSAATMLSFTTDKEKYFTGEKASISFPSSENSRAMISLETGSDIIKSWWINCQAGETAFDIDITEEMAPNFYVYITLIQPHQQTINDLPIRMYGVIPVLVEDPQTLLHPEITAPEKIKPESKFTVTISEKKGRAMTYTIAIVDEGLLGLTRFKTPDPWQSFFSREALGVKTWDMFDDVLGAFGGQIQKILAIGGDDVLTEIENQKANRFKPVVLFSGPYMLKANNVAEHVFTMPNYTGEVRIMVIAGKNGAWGSTEKNVTVNQPLMVLPTLPRMLSPQEEVILPVSVFSMDNKISKVTVSIETEGPIEAPVENQHQLTFSKTGEQICYFKLKAATKSGIARIHVRANSGEETAGASIEIDVVNPNPLTTSTENVILPEGVEKDLAIRFHGIEGSNSGKITVSGFPSFNFEKNLQYLLTYPYGCLEQVVSSAFPQLYLSEIMELTEKQQVMSDRNIRASIRRLQSFRMPDGQFAYWPGSQYISEWSSVYAGHFMFLAEQKGYLIPSSLKNSWLEHQTSLALKFDPLKSDDKVCNQQLQAYRLYALTLAGKPSFSAMNRMRELSNLSQNATWRLAAAYQLAGRPEAAQELINGLSKMKTSEKGSYAHTFGSELRDMAMILETHVLMNNKSAAFELIQHMAEAYQEESLNTQTAAFLIYSIARFAQMTGSDNKISFDYSLGEKKESIISARPMFVIDLDEVSGSEKPFKIKNTGKGDVFITITATGRPDYESDSTEAKNLEMKINYTGLDGSLVDIYKMKQGTDFVAEITLTNPGNIGDYENMVLSYTVPSGWEIINKRIYNAEENQVESPFIYRDIGDKRIDTFFTLETGKTVIYRIELNAAYAGRYYKPSVTCSAMYDNSIYAVEKGNWVEIRK